MAAASIAPLVARDTPMTADALAPLHEQWLAAVRKAFDPVLLGSRAIRDRWTALRHLGQVTERLEQERWMIDRTPGLAPSSRARIENGFNALQRVREQVGKVGGRAASHGSLVYLLAHFVDMLADWYATIEHAAARVPLNELPTKALAALSQLESGNGR